ncbi:serine hydrolase domain-containing protein [Longimicrobium sp.]|uniref:serine hydrolase domain-containing protein n=1 Tax=Longimicrobium sp. TaxID=2029185 RepID=UPI003B3A1180
MRPYRILLAITALLVATAAQGQRTYVPGPGGDWERRLPAQVGMDAAGVDSAVTFALASESTAPRDLEMAHHQTFGREPFGEPVGPFAERGDPAGIIIRRGYIVAEWGDPHRVDMTFSVTKSFLSAVVGLALDRGMIRDVNEPVEPYVGPVFVLPPEGGGRHAGGLGEGRPLRLFDTDRERGITWDHLLRQTSDWEGTLWGKPDWADRPLQNPREWLTRERLAPGAAHEYNDVRVNLLALAALSVWRRPLPQVLREHVMDPIGASPTWRWTGYENSWVLMDGAAVQSVSGGGHWGGGMFISARDMARFGLLTLRRGRWGDRQVLSEAWVRMALTPTPVQPNYGFMNWYLNTDRKQLPSAPATAFVHLGNGTNAIYVDPEHDLVIVARWIANPALDGLVQRAIAAVER